jgi:DNA-binding CsgD family transcriptional regulator
MTLVERDHQISALRRSITAAMGGQGRVVAVRGTVGTGKTALLRVCARDARERGALVLESGASRLERSLALGVLDQLFRGAPPQVSSAAGELLRTSLGAPAAEEATAHALHELCQALLGLAQQRPLVIVVDDAHHADALSVRCLSYLAARIERSPVLLVYGECAAPASGPAFPADLADRANWQQLDVTPLSAHGTARALRDLAVDLPPGTEAVAHRLTGGNPVLLHALADDGRLPSLTTGTATGGDATMRRFLSRLSPAERAVAQGLAVLGPDAPPGLLGRWCDTDPDTVAAASRTLTAAGMLVDDWFRDPALAATALSELPPAERAALRVSAATLLREVNAAPVAVARQLVAAVDLNAEVHRRIPAWAPHLLGRAARQAEQSGDLPFAVRCLRTALEIAGAGTERAGCRAALAKAEWRADPMLAMRHLPELIEAIHAGLLDHDQALPPINWLVWFGQVDEAVALMGHLNRRIAGEPAAVERMHSTRLWLAWLYPSRARQTWPAPGAGDEQNNTALTLDPMLHAARLFTEALATGADDRLVAEVEKVLHGSDVHERTLQMVVALAALVYGERLDVASAWCDVLMRNAESKGAPTQQAIFTAARADIAVRQGDMPRAEQWARTALELLPPPSWGVVVGFPLAALLRATTAMGRHAEAAEWLRVPVPEMMFQTVIGVHYLRARSLYFQATGRHSAALMESRSCGELLAAWGMEAPAFTPWRSDTAVSCLWLGRPEEARALTEEQLALTGPTQLRTRGISLRALAATVPPDERIGLLTDAVSALRVCGDRLELAQALVDLADAHLRTGTAPGTVETEAAELSAACGVPYPAPTGPPEPVGLDMPEPRRSAAPPAEHPNSSPDRLSEAELRVAELAAAGHTNRQIADQLFVTVSTVEQHLTKTYRKLRISNRSQLSSALSVRLSAHTSADRHPRLPVSRSAVVPGGHWR